MALRLILLLVLIVNLEIMSAEDSGVLDSMIAGPALLFTIPIFDAPYNSNKVYNNNTTAYNNTSSV